MGVSRFRRNVFNFVLGLIWGPSFPAWTHSRVDAFKMVTIFNQVESKAGRLKWKCPDGTERFQSPSWRTNGDERTKIASWSTWPSRWWTCFLFLPFLRVIFQVRESQLERVCVCLAPSTICVCVCKIQGPADWREIRAATGGFFDASKTTVRAGKSSCSNDGGIQFIFCLSLSLSLFFSAPIHSLFPRSWCRNSITLSVQLLTTIGVRPYSRPLVPTIEGQPIRNSAHTHTRTHFSTDWATFSPCAPSRHQFHGPSTVFIVPRLSLLLSTVMSSVQSCSIKVQRRGQDNFFPIFFFVGPSLRFVFQEIKRPCL